MTDYKKLNSFEDLASVKLDNVVTSSYDSNKNQKPEKMTQDLECHFSKKGRGGKTATLIKGYRGNTNEIKELAKELKKKLKVGGAVKNGEIIIQGDCREKIMFLLSNMGCKVKRVGG